MRATADVLAFRADGSATTSGWTFHGTRPNWASADDAIEVPASEVARLAPPVGATTQVLALIGQTAIRHQDNRAIARAGLSTRDWHVLFQAMIEAESTYNPTAISPKGAFGLGQLMPATAQDLGVDPRNISQNLDGAARYLLAQLAEFRSVDLALAAYNAGPHRVVQYAGVPPFAETRGYIARIHDIRERLSGGASPEPSIRVASTAPTRAPVIIDLN
ncbi:lytic transglycosylase domain-containing protein [Sulfitobacter sp.]|uniref:lytic transglycosylase domain-containing protein n=1 Tax=Sulfitobacter sp. TaxID=1903071 RepID=UPI0030010C63